MKRTLTVLACTVISIATLNLDRASAEVAACSGVRDYYLVNQDNYCDNGATAVCQFVEAGFGCAGASVVGWGCYRQDNGAIHLTCNYTLD